MDLIGKTAEATLRVSPSQDAETSAVVATSRIVELMEVAASRLMRPRLSPGESTLGVALKLMHVSPTVSGGVIRAVATYRRIDGRLHHFTIHAFDATGLIASCEHTRAVVLPRRLLAAARRRAGLPSMLFEV
jgi:fluoroacetyl-CoA thioesterase